MVKSCCELTCSSRIDLILWNEVTNAMRRFFSLDVDLMMVNKVHFSWVWFHTEWKIKCKWKKKWNWIAFAAAYFRNAFDYFEMFVANNVVNELVNHLRLTFFGSTLFWRNLIMRTECSLKWDKSIQRRQITFKRWDWFTFLLAVKKIFSGFAIK